MEVFNSLEIGKRVWSFSGYSNHGTADGVKINVPTNTGGMISHLSRPYPTIDVFLYSVLWDSGETSKHYYNELDPIGNCKTIKDYEQILVNGNNAKAVVGPQGGFKNFEMTVCFNNTDYLIKLNSEQKKIGIG